MGKHLLEKTKREFVEWFNRQDDKMWYDLATTPFDANTDIARFRRIYLKLLNDRNMRELKS